MRRLAAAIGIALLLAGPARAQTLSGSPLPPYVPTLHQFGNAQSSASFMAGQVDCGTGAVTPTVPIGCVNSDWLSIQSPDTSLSTFFRLGGSWAAGDMVGVDFWLGNGDGSYTRYPVLYTVQASDIAGAGNSLATYQNILAGLAGTDQSGQGDGGCINGTGGYGPALGQVPAAPAHCTGTSAFLLADEKFPDTAGNGYRPQAFASCGTTGSCFLGMDFPWGNNASGGFATHPAVNVALPDVTSAAGTLAVVQQPAANIQNQIFSSGNTLDNGPILGAYRLTANSGDNWPLLGVTQRPDVVGDMLARLDLGEGSIFVGVRGATGQSAAAYASGTTIVLAAAPVMPPSMSLPAGGSATLYVQDATTACAIPPGTTLAAWSSGSNTLTLSQAVNGAAPCPGIASGDLISITGSGAGQGHDEMAFAPNFGRGPVLFLGDGLRTTGTSGPNSACGPDPGYGSLRVCGTIGGGATTATLALVPSTGPSELSPGLALQDSAGYFGLNLFPKSAGLPYLDLTGIGAGNAPLFTETFARGTLGALANAQANDQIGDFNFATWTAGGSWGSVVNFVPSVVENVDASHWAGQLDIQTRNTAEVTASRLRITGTGGISIGGAGDPGTGAINAAGGVYSNGAPLLPTLGGTTGTIGGGALGAGTCTSGAVAVTGATAGMAVAASPTAYPGDGFGWRGYVSAGGTVTVKLCNQTGGSLTPTASAYNVRVLQ